MKIGIITDIHNNSVALEAVLARFSQENCDGVICCGDIIGIGPYPEETVKIVMNIPNLMTCVKGNHESYFVEGIHIEPNMSAEEAEHHKHMHILMSPSLKEFLCSLKFEEYLEVDGKKIYVAHYALDENNRFKRGTERPTLGQVQQLFSGIEADVILYGHHHTKYIFRDDKLYINCGSLGCPHSDSGIAKAGILVIDDKITFTELEVQYDVVKVLADMDEMDYSGKDTIKKIFFGRG